MNIPQQPPLEVVSASPVCGSIIWLHGLGADGYDFVDIPAQLTLPQDFGIRFVFPHAPYQAVTINGGQTMRAWYDVKGLDFIDREDRQGIQASEATLCALIKREIERGIAPHLIMLAGFSQGGAVSLYTGLRYPEPLAGILALSTYLPLTTDSNCHLPRHLGLPIMMAHGTADNVIPLALGERSRDIIEKSGIAVEWHTYPMSHSLCLQEIQDISTWITKTFTQARNYQLRLD